MGEVIAAPVPSFAQRELITATRERVAQAVERTRVSPGEIADTWAAYNAACAAAGVRTPPPAESWPTGPSESPHTRSLRERATKTTAPNRSGNPRRTKRMTEYVTPPRRTAVPLSGPRLTSPSPPAREGTRTSPRLTQPGSSPR